jgi:hypothetical protein
LSVAKRPKVVLRVEREKMGENGDYKFVATATTENERNIEFFAFKIWVKNTPSTKVATPQEENSGEYQLLTSDNFNKTGILEYELKKGEYKIVATATDEYGLTGEDEVEIVVR